MNKIDFKEIFDTYFDQLRSYIFYRCADADMASDIAQDVFMKIWEKRDILDTKHIKALLYKMANDMVINVYRKETSHLNFVQYMVVENNTTTPYDELHYKELKNGYESALNQMSEAQREAFLLSRNDELKYKEISERLGISIKAVEKRISGALQLIKKTVLTVTQSE